MSSFSRKHTEQWKADASKRSLRMWRTNREFIVSQMQGRKNIKGWTNQTSFKKGNVPWITGKTSATDERVRISNEKKSKTRRLRYRVNQICEICGITFSKKKSRVNARFCSITCKGISIRGKPQAWAEKRILSVIKGLRKRPTAPEKKFQDVVNKYHLPYKYNGFVGDLMIGRKIPDFYNNNGKKQVVEIDGRAFHDINNPSPFKKRTPDDAVLHYRKYGFECISFWEDELDDEKAVLKKLGVDIES